MSEGFFARRIVAIWFALAALFGGGALVTFYLPVRSEGINIVAPALESSPAEFSIADAVLPSAQSRNTVAGDQDPTKQSDSLQKESPERTANRDPSPGADIVTPTSSPRIPSNKQNSDRSA